MRKYMVAFCAAAALVASGPVVAQSQALPADLPARTGAPMEDANNINGGYIIPTVAILGLILAVLALTDTWPFDEDPVSP